MLVVDDSVYSHTCRWQGTVWRFNVPMSKRRSFWRKVKAGECYSPGAEVHQVPEQACIVEAWADAHVEETGNASDRISAFDIAEAFKRDTGADITARALGDTLTRVLAWHRVKSNGNAVYTGVKFLEPIA